MSIDLGPYLDAVPDAVVERLRNARRVLAVGHENPDADTLGATLGIVRIVETLGGTADPVCTDPVPALYDFLSDVERFRTDPDPKAPYDLLVVSDCGSLDRIGDVRGRHPELFERLPRVVIDHHASNDAAGETDWIEPAAAATCEMVALLATRLDIPLDTGDGSMAAALMGGIVMDTATFAHPNATPRTLAVSAALVEAGAPLSDISRRLYRSKPAAQLRLFGRVLDRIDGDRRRARRSIRPCSTRTSPPPGRSRRTRRGSSTCSRRPTKPRWPSCSRRPASRRGSASGRSPGAWTPPS